LPDVQRRSKLIELDSGTLHCAQHAALGLRPALRLVEADAVDAGDGAVVDRAEGRDQRRDEDGRACVFVAPRACRLIAQHVAGNVVVEGKRARLQIFLNDGSARIDAVLPDGKGARNADQIVRGALVALALDGNGGRLIAAPGVAIARLPRRQAALLAYMVPAIAPIVAAVAEEDEAVVRVGCELDDERAVFG